ncbi:hypothetical protein K469DRAFT_683357 [Zopfia rhizophila CBS 207.26]|uniref:Diels-Alderase n=1 Tax=Zopfia rhizophila CBS 207.26 TaxID=1314779 RepID=A0A6A6D9U6_9PEZI|nr:hypothetical protein K469DRAFT_683357 [Zopfia rhizophila CBS 207.26]
MADLLTSHFNIDGDSIVLGPVPVSPFIPGSGNTFPKFVDAIAETAWELWYFDGVSEDRAAIVIGVTRNAEGRKHGGFKVQVFGIWPDETTWHRDLYFPESVVTTAGEAGDVLGVWKDPPKNSSISFQVSADSSQAKLTFNVPGVVEGSMSLAALPGNTGLDTHPELGSSVYYVRPIGQASVTAEMAFYHSESIDPRKLLLGSRGGSARGGMDRVWSPFSWPQIMTESYYLRAQVGPYAMQVMRIFSDVESGNKPHAVARLYRDGKLICAAQSVVGTGKHEVLEDSLIVSKVYGNPTAPGLTGTFRDKNNGYVVEFIQGDVDGQRWQFQVRHDRTLWNMPTSAPGPNATGNTGFVESLVGGLSGEAFIGIGTGGQCELS